MPARRKATTRRRPPLPPPADRWVRTTDSRWHLLPRGEAQSEHATAACGGRGPWAQFHVGDLPAGADACGECR